MQRFFLPPEIAGKLSTITLEDNFVITTRELIHQIKDVLRLKNNDHCILLDNTKKEYESTIITIKNDAVSVKINAMHPCTTEPQTKITIYQAIPKQLEKLELVIQKGTELGAHEFVPLQTERSAPRTLSPQKILRFRTIAREAAEQSERGIWPHVTETQTLHGSLEECKKTGRTIICLEGREKAETLSTWIANHQKSRDLGVFIGPEGGFAPQEIAMLKDYGAVLVTLGPRILRTETAPIAFLAGFFCDGQEK